MILSEFCSLFYAAHYLPIACYDRKGFVASAGFAHKSDPYLFVLPKLRSGRLPSVYASSDTGFYGRVTAGEEELVIGPAYATPVTQEVIRAYMQKNAISPSQEGDIAQFLGGIPQYTYNQFLNLLVYLHYTFNKEVLSVTETFGIDEHQYEALIGQQQAHTAYEAREEQQNHGTFLFERRMLELVQQGDTDRLNAFLMDSLKAEPMREGKLADSPLRQAKNLLIGTTAVVGKYAAIPGGMDVEQAYQLIDTYTQECERTQSLEAIKVLQYNMLMDFTRRVAQQRLPQGISPEVRACMQFIASHLNESIGIAEVAAQCAKSRSWLCSRFKQELGIGIGEYITLAKLREAKSLLRYTSKPLSEISSYLGFSSQPYFQNVFRKYEGVTPMQFRVRHSPLQEAESDTSRTRRQP